MGASLNVTLSGVPDGPPMVFIHGFGCGQEMWRRVAPHFEDSRRVVTFDLPGAGGADPSSYDADRHSTLSGYRDDVIRLLEELDVRGAVVVGHSVAATIAILVHAAAPHLVERLVLITPSARYIDDGAYRGGFEATDIEQLLETMSRNHFGWQDSLATMIASDGDAGGDAGGDAEVAGEMYTSFCRTRPEVARQFAEVTFVADNRADLASVTVPTLVLASSSDAVAPASATSYVHEHITGSTLQTITTIGHCPHLSAPAPTVEAIRRFLRAPRAAQAP